jgi:hypothetical protein
MTFEEFWATAGWHDDYKKDVREVWDAAQQAERGRIKSRVKDAAESLWCIRNQVGDEPYGLYIGPSLNTLDDFVEKLLEEN